MAGIHHISNAENPTIAEFIQCLVSPLEDVTREEVIQAAHARGVTLKDGRIQAHASRGEAKLSDLYFGLMELRGHTGAGRTNL